MNPWCDGKSPFQSSGVGLDVQRLSEPTRVESVRTSRPSPPTGSSGANIAIGIFGFAAFVMFCASMYGWMFLAIAAAVIAGIDHDEEEYAAYKRNEAAWAAAEARAARREQEAREAKEAEWRNQIALDAWKRSQTYEAKRKAFNRDEELRSRIKLRDNFTCQECGSRMRLTVDHIIPLSLGGSNGESNLRCLCRSCNSRKGARW